MDLVANPVLVHQMRRQQQAARKARKAKPGASTTRGLAVLCKSCKSGAAARAGNHETLSQLDRHLKSRGIAESSQQGIPSTNWALPLQRRLNENALSLEQRQQQERVLRQNCSTVRHLAAPARRPLQAGIRQPAGQQLTIITSIIPDSPANLSAQI